MTKLSIALILCLVWIPARALCEEHIISDITNNGEFTFTGDSGSSWPALVSDYDCDQNGANDRLALNLTTYTADDGYEGKKYYWSMRWEAVQDEGTLQDPANPGHTIPEPTDTYKNVGKWKPRLDKTGCYRIQAYIPWNSTAKAKYTIHDVFGNSSVLIKQYRGDNRCEAIDDWVALSDTQYHFDAGDNGYVTLSDDTGEDEKTCVAFDAMKFVLHTAASVTVKAFADLNNDGQRQTTEPLRSAAVQLYEGTGCSGTLLGTGTASGSAGWTYTDATKLKFKTFYTAKVVGGNCSSYATATIDNDCGAVIYAPVCRGKIRICKYLDQNLNGTFDPGEGVQNWPFKIDGDATIYYTGANGCTTDIEVDGDKDYTIIEWNDETGSAFTADTDVTFRNKRYHIYGPVRRTVHVDCDETEAVEVTYRNVCLGTLTVCKYADQNLDNSYVGDDGVVNWPFHIDGPDNFSRNVTTGANGCVTVEDLMPGEYTITESINLEANGLTFDDPRPGETKRWKIVTPVVQNATVDCSDETVRYLDVCLGSITVCKFEDVNMNGIKDADEEGIADWPIYIDNVQPNNIGFALLKHTGADGCIKFEDLEPGQYTIAEDGVEIQWDDKLQVTCGNQTYWDWRATWTNPATQADERWQFTSLKLDSNPTITDPSQIDSSKPLVEFALSCSDHTVTFGNVCLTTVPAFKFHDLNIDGLYGPTGEPFTDLDGSGKWTRAEPLTDLDCDGNWDDNEFKNDLNGNGKWDPAEPFNDLDGDGQYDWPECPLVNWPFAFNGNRIDGKPVCLAAVTDDAGMVVFEDVAPADAAGYDLYEDLDWCDVDIGWPQLVKRTSFDNLPPCNGTQDCRVTRWQATTEVSQIVRPYCEPEPLRSFGNVCLASVSGIKLVFDDGMPGDVQGKPGAGWEICLAGEDHNRTPIIPSLLTGQPGCAAYANAPAATKAPIGIPCITPPTWYSAITAADGTFGFVDLLPGHYHLTEQPHPDYKMRISEPMLCGFDLICCPVDGVEIQNIRKGLAYKVYQAYPGDSGGQDLCFQGSLPPVNDAISAVPGVLAICPGKEWVNFAQAAELCREQGIKNVSITKSIPETLQCQDVFQQNPAYPGFTQHGSEYVRLWWPLMFEVPGTEFTLRIIYGTRTKVQFPGETAPNYVHTEEWRWLVDADLESMKLAIRLFHQLPFGLCEVPLISGEQYFQSLLDKLDEVQAAFNAEDRVRAGQLLVEFEMLVMDECTPDCSERALGTHVAVVDTVDYPVCCKLLVDAEYVGWKLGIWQTGR